MAAISAIAKFGLAKFGKLNNKIFHTKLFNGKKALNSAAKKELPAAPKIPETPTREYTLKKDNSKYLYHLTTKQNWEQIQKSGKIAACEGVDTLKQKDVFMFSLENMLNSWSKSNNILSKDYLDNILRKVGRTGDIVLLRINAKALNHDKLKVRLLNKIFSLFKKGDFDNKYLAGENSGISYIYKQRKSPFEYLYTDNISLKDVEKIGESKFSGNVYSADSKKIMTNLLKDSPEKGFSFLI